MFNNFQPGRPILTVSFWVLSYSFVLPADKWVNWDKTALSKWVKFVVTSTNLIPIQDSASDPLSQNRRAPEGAHRTSTAGVSSNMRKASSTTNIVDDLSSIFGGIFSFSLFWDNLWLFFFCYLKPFFVQKLLQHLVNSKKLKGKLRKDEEQDWKESNALKSARYGIVENFLDLKF